MHRILYVLILFSLWSCDIINPEEDIPAYIEFESFNLTTTLESGSDNENITEGWLYVNNDLIGAFSVDKPVPVLYEGTVEIIVDPGIHEDGIGFTPSLYPFYTRYTTTVDLVPGEVTTITPEFEYREDIEFVFIQEFENNTIFTIDRDGDENTAITYTTEGALEGVSAKIELTDANPIFEVATNAAYELPVFVTRDAFLEINFKTDVPIAIGLIYQDDFGNIIPLYGNGLNTTAEWKKVYINLQEIILNNPEPPYQVGFTATLPTDQSTGTIFVDNIKLLHFKE